MTDLPTYRTTITFLTHEPVTPDFLAMRLVQQCGGALRVGEGCELPSDPSQILQRGEGSMLDQIRETMPDFLRDPSEKP